MKNENFEIGENVKLGKNIRIENDVQILGDTSIGDDCVLMSGSRIENCIIGDGCEIDKSVVTNSTLGKGCKIGPYANIRPGCVLGENVKVGAFVELKNAVIGSGTKMAHLSYIGDADLGENVNVGCGVVFANYDGKQKHKSKVGNNVFIGCNVNIVAPVNIADRTYICAGTTITKDTEEGDFVIGRVRQENKKRDIKY